MRCRLSPMVLRNAHLNTKSERKKKFCNNYPPCREEWAAGRRVYKYIGYDAGETRRIQHAAPADEANKKYKTDTPYMNGVGTARNACA